MAFYYLVSIIIGILYYFGASFGFNISGAYLGWVFEYYRPDYDQVVVVMGINFLFSCIGSIVPAAVLMIVIHENSGSKTRGRVLNREFKTGTEMINYEENW